MEHHMLVEFVGSVLLCSESFFKYDLISFPLIWFDGFLFSLIVIIIIVIIVS